VGDTKVTVTGLGGTYGGNPVACAAALASITTMRQHDLASAARHIETIAKPRLNALAAQCPTVGQVRGRGAMLALELIDPRTRQPNPELTTKVAHTCHNAGVVVLTCGTYANVIRLLPPLVIPQDLLTEGLDVLTHAILTATT
jgi:4-aminobutyrate aminotransferase/(S)-3-amino-2-methylpropionate transaminase